MVAASMVFRSALRERWRSWLLLAALVALTGGASLAALAAGVATNRAVPSLVTSTHSPDLFTVFGGPPELGFAQITSAQIAGLPGVVHDEIGLNYQYQSVTVGGHTYPAGQNALTLLGLPHGPPRPGDLAPKLVAGRFSDPSKPDEVVADYSGQQSIPGLGVGAAVQVSLYTPTESSALQTGTPAPGPHITLRVVGLVLSGSSLPGGHTAALVLTTPAFIRQEATQALTTDINLVRLRRGPADLATAMSALQGLPGVQPSFGNLLVVSADSGYADIQRSIGPQVVGWWVLAGLAAAGAIVVLAQGLARQTAAEARPYITLRALGMRPADLLGVGLARCAVIGLVGAAGAVALAVSLSSLTPVGEARRALPSPGITFHGQVLLPGIVALIVLVLLAGAWPCWRASRGRLAVPGGEAPAVRRPSRVVAWLARAGGTPPALIGTRQALERGRSPDAPPAGSALAGAVLAVAALAGTLIFGASLAHLLATPPLYGDDFALSTPPGGSAAPNGVDVQQLLTSQVASLPGVTQITVGGPSEAAAGALTFPLLAFASLKGAPLVSVVAGRLPVAPGEVALGATTLHQLHTRIGAMVSIDPVTQTVALQVVGEVSLPFNFDGGTGGLGTGAVMTLPGIVAAGCPPEQCAPGVAPIVYLAVSHDAAGRSALAQIQAAAADPSSPLHYLTLEPPLANPPSSLVNFGEAVSFPLLLALIIVVFAVASLLHALVVGVIRRRREIGTLKSLGFVRRQVGAVVTWQALTVLAVGLVIGVPLGFAAGRDTWSLFAAQVGVVNVTVVPRWQLAAMAGASLVAALVIAGIPAILAARLPPARLLREG